jgi:hypothetical protein
MAPTSPPFRPTAWQRVWLWDGWLFVLPAAPDRAVLVRAITWRAHATGVGLAALYVAVLYGAGRGRRRTSTA